MKRCKTWALGALLLALSAAIAAPAIARDNDRGRQGHDRGQHDRRHDDRGRHDRGRHNWSHDRSRGYDRRVYIAPAHVYVAPRPRYVVRHHAPRYYNAPRYYHRPAPRWVRGVRYHQHGYGPTYVVHDYRPYGLRAPPRGHYWRRSDAGDFLLVAVATGIIADLILHR